MRRCASVTIAFLCTWFGLHAHASAPASAPAPAPARPRRSTRHGHEQRADGHAQQVGHALRERVHRDARAPQHKVRRHLVPLRRPVRRARRVHDAVAVHRRDARGGDEVDARVEEPLLEWGDGSGWSGGERRRADEGEGAHLGIARDRLGVLPGCSLGALKGGCQNSDDAPCSEYARGSGSGVSTPPRGRSSGTTRRPHTSASYRRSPPVIKTSRKGKGTKGRNVERTNGGREARRNSESERGERGTGAAHAHSS